MGGGQIEESQGVVGGGGGAEMEEFDQENREALQSQDAKGPVFAGELCPQLFRR